jgi:SOS-response transcriptional repressor LexA
VNKKPFPIPVVPAGEPETDAALDHCSGGESFALMVLGDSMEPEFVEGDIIVIEPDGLARDGSYVMAWLNDEWIFRQLAGCQGDWKLRPLNPKYPAASIPDLTVIKGVIIQKSKPGRRKAAKRYVD